MTAQFELIDTFSGRPSLSPLARDALCAALLAYDPSLHLDPDVATVTGLNESGEPTAHTLMTCLRKAFSSGKTYVWTNGQYRLRANPAAPDSTDAQVDMQQLALVIDSVSLGLLDGFIQALLEFWDRSGPNGLSPGVQLAQALARRAGVEEGITPVPETFARQALHILNGQIQAIQAVPQLGFDEFDEIERYLARATDISPFFSEEQAGAISAQVSRLDQLPDWLRTASSADRLDYSRKLAALAVAAERAEGKSWDDDLLPLLEYARKTLQDALRQDHPDLTWLTLDDITVHIDKVVAAAIPAAGQVVAVGSVEHLQMSVARFALGNLCAIPAGTLRLSMRDGGPPPSWLTVDYLKQLVVRVDIGGTYPALVRTHLIIDPTEAARRQRLFADQLRVQLPLKALEQKIRGEGGLTQAGYRRVCGLLTPSQKLAGDTILRPLAWVVEPGAVADEVCNMFVIGAQDTAVGPFVLYRPLARLPLMEFATWSDLRDAIAKAGELQDDVLPWMSEQGRRRYANGGFDQPHTVRFGQGSEFAPIDRPAPAQLGSDPVRGDLIQMLFDANARALVDLADQESVSNAESRWALLQRAGWLGLDLVMPFLSGAVGNALWLVQLMSAVDQVLVAQKRNVGREQRQAWNSLVLTISMILLHQGFAPRLQASSREVPARLDETELVNLQPEAAESASAQVPSGLVRQLDFSWSSLQHTLTPDQAQRLERLRVMPEPALINPSNEPGRQGLYAHDGQWWARLDSGVYQVGFSDDEVHVLDPQDPDSNGPRLKRVGKAWTLDLALGLRGGGPKRDARQVALENLQRLQQVIERDAVLEQHKKVLYQRFVGWHTTCRGAAGQLSSRVYDQIEKDLIELRAIVEEKQRLQASLRPADRAPETVMVAILRGLVRRIAFYEGVLLQSLVKLARAQMDRLETVSVSAVTPENVDGYIKLFEDMLEIEERGANWSGQREVFWQQLRNVPKVGQNAWRDEVLELLRSNVFTHLDWRATRMWSLLELSFTKDIVLSKEGSAELKGLRTDDRLHAAVCSQIELEKPNDYSLAEQIDVLESSLREYERGMLVATCAQETLPDAFDPVRFGRFLEEFKWIFDRAEKRLSDLIRESTEPLARAPEYAPRVRQPRKRVFKTRAQRTLVGQLRDGEPDMPGAVVDITQSMGETVIETYHLHENGEWVEVVSPPRPEAHQAKVAVAELKRQAAASLARVESDIGNARRQSRRVDEPADMQDILVHKADRLSALADQLADAVADDETVQSAVAALRSAASRLVTEGRTLRIAMIKAQPPTAARLAYLAQEQEVDIARFEGRKNMSGPKRNDFLQEYVIRNKDQRVLWWAHFHYASEGANAVAFTAAHLKLPEQRFIGYKAQVKAAKNNKEVISVYRSAIGKDVAQRLFLNLAG